MVEKSHQTSENRWVWKCICECGEIAFAAKNQLEHGGKKECLSCSRKKLGFKHGGKGSKLYSIWGGMHARCNRPSSKAFIHYGARGIKVCQRWADFSQFRSDMGDPPNGFELDRIDTNGDYEPANCRWVTQQENLRNRRNSKRWIVYGTEFPSCCAAAKHHGVSTTTIVRWCEGGFDNRDGRKFGPKQNCKSYKVYENS